ncbi:alpha/beta fold hydrolase [Nocardia sp. CDC186]|uniref:Alpha/beta fold hydrolase n=1 Tax=Nocardia implantans TaxID=3108168 RepID=A0ABU6AVE2_9NOCA|nr:MULTISPECIES: alpha/beta fold hydrolase [unclassified Nocardia]MBF6192421.1 alpha/beta hydrolase [Nocardia beijingensis]MEA3527676.1 alpha/beta fold hydrolase [Nocardia sp. CDC192]MEB3511384.1 alpha/beta fold hydrolase [Nocardia sp. CDC186]
MTLTESDLTPLADAAPPRVVADVDGIPVSGLLAEAPAPRAVLVALHGGATTSAYFDCPGHPELSLLRIAQRLGYTVLALDRPGYGASGPFGDQLTAPRRRVDLMYGAVEAHLAGRPRGAGVFLLAHSAGCELAMRMAGDDRGGELLGVELAGTGRIHHPEAQEVLWGPRPEGTRPALGGLLWRPSRLYPPELVGGAAIAVPGPRVEAAVVTDWAGEEFPRMAARVRIPVRFTAGDHESVWRNDIEELTAIGALFRSAPRVVLNLQPNTGHNASLGYTAAAYHLQVLAFAEECVVAAATGEFSGPAIQVDGGAHARPGR